MRVICAPSQQLLNFIKTLSKEAKDLVLIGNFGEYDLLKMLNQFSEFKKLGCETVLQILDITKIAEMKSLEWVSRVLKKRKKYVDHVLLETTKKHQSPIHLNNIYD